MKPRDTYRYELKDGRQTVYFGISNGPKDRLEEHARDDKNFTRMNVVGPAVSEDSAHRWEAERLAVYRKNHGGKNPKYNQTDTG